MRRRAAVMVSAAVVLRVVRETLEHKTPEGIADRRGLCQTADAGRSQAARVRRKALYGYLVGRPRDRAADLPDGAFCL